MKTPTILVTGATGKTGSAVAVRLLEKGWSVRAVVRAHDARSERLARLGAETVVADLFDPDQLYAAMRGTSRAYYCPPWHPFMLQSATAFAIAAREAKLESIVALTQWLASPAHPSLLTRQHWLADSVFALLPSTAHTAIVPGFFADNYLTTDVLQYAVHLGVYPWPYGASLNAPPSNDDIARIAVAALIDPERHAGRSYRPTGPELLSGDDIAAVVGRVLARRIRKFDMPTWMFANAMRVAGWSQYEQMSVMTYVDELRRGTFEFNSPTDDVLETTGAPAESFETTARRYLASSRLRRNLPNALRTLRDFMLVGMLPPTDLARVAREHQHPISPTPRLASDDERWLIAHDAESPSPSFLFPLERRETPHLRLMEHA